MSLDQATWPLTLKIRRKAFVRLVSAGLLAIAVAFFCFLLLPPGNPSPEKAVKDLMAQALGFVGTLWAIRAVMVPASVKIFPTLVDYVVLTLFVAVFVTIVVRYVHLYETARCETYEQEDL